MRKEFFYTTIDKLENLVTEICPTAEFNKTMLAKEFRQSQSTDKIYTSILVEEPDDIDMKMIEEMKNDTDCREFVSSNDAMKMLGL